jgi:tetratricopeptide (TPR) repeat protein
MQKALLFFVCLCGFFACLMAPLPSREGLSCKESLSPKRARQVKEKLDKVEILITQGKCEESVTILKEVIEEDSKCAAAYDRLAYAFMVLGKADEAERNAAKAVQLDPGLSVSYNILGMSEERRNNNAQALEYYLKAVKNDPRYAKAFNNLGNSYLRSSDFKKAEETYRAALSLDPTLAMAHNNLARVLELQGKIQEARKEYEKALQIDPAMEMAKENLKRLQERQAPVKLTDKDRACARSICHFEIPEGYALVKASEAVAGGGRLAVIEYRSFQKFVLRELPKDNKIDETVFAQMIVKYKSELITLLEGLMEGKHMKVVGQGYVDLDRRKVLYVSTVFEYDGSPVEGIFSLITSQRGERSVLIIALAPRGLYQRSVTDGFLKKIYF